MNRIQTLIFHGPLLILLFVLVAERPGFTPTTEAEPTRLEDELGPADRLVLRGPQGEVAVTATDGGISWGDQPTERTWSLATVNVPSLMRALMESERFEEDRLSLREEAETQNAEFEAQFEEFRDEYGELTPEDPKFPEAQERWQRMMQEYQQWQQGTVAIQQKLGSEQIETAYRELVDATDIVAERLGVEMVIRFVPPDEPFNSETLDQASDQVGRRLFLKYPDAIDITAKVEAELGV